MADAHTVRRRATAAGLALSLWPLGACTSPRPEITTVLGTGVRGFGGDGGPGDRAQVAVPLGVAVDANGTLYVGDSGNGRLRAVTPDGRARTVLAQHDFRPWAVGVARDGALYLAEKPRHRVLRVEVEDGTVAVVAGTEKPGASGDGGPGTEARLAAPAGLALDRHGNLFIAEVNGHRVRKLSRGGTISTIAGTGTPGFSGDGGPATAARLNEPSGLATVGDELYVADAKNHRIRKISLDEGTIATVAGTGEPGFYGDGGPATEAQLSQPAGLAAGPGGLYVADSANHRVRVVRPDGTISTVAGNGASGWVAGSGPAPGDGGPAAEAPLRPQSLALDRRGHLYVSDFFNHRVRRIALGDR